MSFINSARTIPKRQSNKINLSWQTKLTFFSFIFASSRQIRGRLREPEFNRRAAAPVNLGRDEELRAARARRSRRVLRIFIIFFAIPYQRE